MNATRRRAIAVAVSGGRDSMALLHALTRAARAQRVQVWALHVHHGLQTQADGWSTFVEKVCKRWAARGAPLRFAMQRLSGAPAAGQSVEAWARAGRYAALARMARAAGCNTVALAHHRSDQAETFLLQALRGAGPAGLAAMPRIVDRDGIRWVRPWLEQPREAIDAYVRMHRLGHIDDASNADPQFARSRLRHSVMPALRAAFPDAEQALASAAAQAARARALIDEVAKSDLAAVCDGAALVLQRWHALSPVRRRECLRAWLAPLARSGVGDALLDRLDAELPGTKPARWPFDGVELRRYRGTITATAVPPPACAPTWPCRAEIDRVGIHKVPGSKSTLHVRKVRSDGVALALLREACWQTRRGAERFQRAHGTPARSLKKQFQAAGIPAWSRDAPLLYGANGQLIFVPGLGTDARALAEPGQPRVTLTWEPDT